jgi:Fic family protein
VASGEAQNSGGKERVSFDTNMSMEDECSDGGPVVQKAPPQMTVVEQFHARKFKEHHGSKAEKRAVLKVTSVGSSKK